MLYILCRNLKISASEIFNVTNDQIRNSQARVRAASDPEARADKKEERRKKKEERRKKKEERKEGKKEVQKKYVTNSMAP